MLREVRHDQHRSIGEKEIPMSRHTLDRPFNQEWFDELKREARTTLNALTVFTGTPGKIHDRNRLCSKLRYRVETIKECGEHYYLFDSGPLKGNMIFYTLNSLKVLIDTANRFLKGGKV